MNRKQAEHDRTVLPRIQALLAQSRSRREIAEQLQQDGVPTARRGGKWTHIAVGRILARAERTQPQEASPPAAQAEPPPPPTEQAAAQAEPPPPPTEQAAAQAEPPSPPTEPPPTPAPQFQKIEEQFEKAVDQLSARIQEREERLGTAVDQLSARLQDKIGTAESQVDERLNTLNWSFTRLWVRPLCVSVAAGLGVLLVAWGFTEAVAYRIDSQRETLAELKSDIEEQQATLRELEQDTWGVGYRELETGRFLVLPEDSLRNWEVGGKPAVKLPDK